MIKGDSASNAQSWELEVVCKNRKYLTDVVNAILDDGKIDFEVCNVDGGFTFDTDEFDGHYTVLMSCSWFHNLKLIADALEKIEEKYEGTFLQD